MKVYIEVWIGKDFDVFFWDETYIHLANGDTDDEQYWIDRKRKEFEANAQEFTIHDTVYYVNSAIVNEYLAKIMVKYDRMKHYNLLTKIDISNRSD